VFRLKKEAPGNGYVELGRKEAFEHGGEEGGERDG